MSDPPPLGASATFTNVTCFGGSDGAIDVTAIGGVGAYTYSWSDLDPEAFWAFDGNTDDITGNGHHARIEEGNLQYSPDAVDGPYSLRFDGSSSLVYDDDMGFLETTFSERTVTMWIKPNIGGNQNLYEEGSIFGGVALRLRNNRLIASVAAAGQRYFSFETCLLYTSPSPRDATLSRMPSSA